MLSVTSLLTPFVKVNHWIVNDSTIPNPYHNVNGAYYRPQSIDSIPKAIANDQDSSWKQCIGDHWLQLNEDNNTMTARWLLSTSNGTVVYEAVTSKDYLPDPTKHAFPMLSYTDTIDYRLICKMHDNFGFGSQNASESDPLRLNLRARQTPNAGVSGTISPDWIWCIALGALLLLVLMVGICILRTRALNKKQCSKNEQLQTTNGEHFDNQEGSRQIEMEQTPVNNTELTPPSNVCSKSFAVRMDESVSTVAVDIDGEDFFEFIKRLF